VILPDRIDVTVIDGGGIIGIMPELFECVAVKTIQSRHRSEPHKSAAVLENTVDLVMGQTVVDVEMGKIKVGGLANQFTAQQQKCRYKCIPNFESFGKHTESTECVMDGKDEQRYEKEQCLPQADHRSSDPC